MKFLLTLFSHFSFYFFIFFHRCFFSHSERSFFNETNRIWIFVTEMIFIFYRLALIVRPRIQLGPPVLMECLSVWIVHLVTETWELTSLLWGWHFRFWFHVIHCYSNSFLWTDRLSMTTGLLLNFNEWSLEETERLELSFDSTEFLYISKHSPLNSQNKNFPEFCWVSVSLSSFFGSLSHFIFVVVILFAFRTVRSWRWSTNPELQNSIDKI
jgi:hypothetical protein